jgi:uroporphyrinogen decarboxylase
MRQAGRYMSEYRELRQKYGMLEIIHQPELSCQVTMQPIDAFDLDAAIIFADILPPLGGLGLKVGFEAGEGPIVYNPVRDEADVRALATPTSKRPPGLPSRPSGLSGGAGRPWYPVDRFQRSPFTLASYAVEGGSSKDFTTKRLMMGRPDVWRQLMSKLAGLVGGYLRAQAQAGAQVLQLFDTWAGLLSPPDYLEFALPYNQAVIKAASQAGVPVIYFSTGTSGILELVAQRGRCDRRRLARRSGEAWRRLGPGVAIQGNLDPVALLGDRPELERRAAAVLESAGGRPGHIFNLGHGVLRDTPVDSVRQLVDFVHEYRFEDGS